MKREEKCCVCNSLFISDHDNGIDVCSKECADIYDPLIHEPEDKEEVFILSPIYEHDYEEYITNCVEDIEV